MWIGKKSSSDNFGVGLFIRSSILVELPRWLSVKNQPASAGDTVDYSLIPGSGSSPGGGNGSNVLACENPMDR